VKNNPLSQVTLSSTVITKKQSKSNKPTPTCYHMSVSAPIIMIWDRKYDLNC